MLCILEVGFRTEKYIALETFFERDVKINSILPNDPILKHKTQNVVDLLVGEDVPGSIVNIDLKRGEEMFQVLVCCSASECMCVGVQALFRWVQLKGFRVNRLYACMCACV